MLARLLVPQTPHSPLGHGCGIQTLGDVSPALLHVHVRGEESGEMPWHQDYPMDGPDTWALPELVFFICSHEMFPPFVAANGLGHFCPKTDAAKPLPPDNECNDFWEQPVVGLCALFPRRLQNQGCFWERTNPTCPSLVYSQVCHVANIPHP